MSNPTRQEIIDAHKTLERLIAGAYDISPEEAKKIPSYVKIAKFLPPKPQPTMADVVWDDEKHFLAEAKTANGLLVAMLRKDQDQWISCIRVGTSPALRTRTEFEGYLTPTGKRYTLTETTND